MPLPMYTPSCVAPGAQGALFDLACDGPPRYAVLDRSGSEQARTAALGVALSAARRLVVEQGEAWVRSSDGATARIDASGVSTDTPNRPWIQTLALTLEDMTSPKP